MSSPFPWISDEVWDLWNRYNPLGADFVDVSPINYPILTIVSEDDRRRAPIAPVPPNVQVPPQGTLQDHESLLAKTTGTGYIGWVRWPVCCGCLSTLLMAQGGGNTLEKIEAEVGTLDDALLEAHTEDTSDPRSIVFRDWAAVLWQMRRHRYGGDGINAFQCRSCGRIYGAYSEP